MGTKHDKEEKVIKAHEEWKDEKESNNEEEMKDDEDLMDWERIEDQEYPQDADDKKCPVCKKQLKNVLLHIRKSNICKSRVSDDKLRELESKSKKIRKEKVNKNFREYYKRIDQDNRQKIINQENIN